MNVTTQPHRFRTICAALILATACASLAAQVAPPVAAPQQTQTPEPPSLTLAQAEHLALMNNPRISIARLLQLAQGQVITEVRSRELPTATVNLTAVDAHQNSLITAGYLSNSSVYNRAAGGISISQMITDFGRTHDLILSAQSDSRALLNEQRATAQDVTLAVDEAFYKALSSQAVLHVAQQTVAARQATMDRITALAEARLKSSLDKSFADVELSQAKLLLLDAENSAQETITNLNALLGSEANQQYTLVDETPSAASPAPESAEPLVQQAFNARPDLAALKDSYTAARQFSAAEHALGRPAVSALASFGNTPVRASQINSSWYGAAGVNINIPVFTGLLNSSRAHEADLRANVAQEKIRSLRELIARDVRAAVLEAQAAYQRIQFTQQLRDQSNLALDLAQTRYQLGLSGIVELSQAQLAQTQGEIAYANARYAYQTSLAVLNYQTGQ
jgi:outer membrane protein